MLGVMNKMAPREWTTREAGKAGGKARAESLTKARRVAIARKAAQARWTIARAKKAKSA